MAVGFSPALGPKELDELAFRGGIFSLCLLCHGTLPACDTGPRTEQSWTRVQEGNHTRGGSRGRCSSHAHWPRRLRQRAHHTLYRFGTLQPASASGPA